MTSLKTYVWEDFLIDFTSGLAVAQAENIEQAREMILEKVRKEDNRYVDAAVRELKYDPLIIESANAFWVPGGG